MGTFRQGIGLRVVTRGEDLAGVEYSGELFDDLALALLPCTTLLLTCLVFNLLGSRSEVPDGRRFRPQGSRGWLRLLPRPGGKSGYREEGQK